MKKAILIIALCFITSLACAETLVCGSIKSDKFHRMNCRYVQKIKPSYLIIDSPEFFIKWGYIPCKNCNPPVKSEVKDVGR